MKNSGRTLFKHTRLISLIGLMVALSVAIGWACKTYLTFGPIRITFENIPVILSGIVCGPFVGAVVAVFSDIVSCLMSPNPSLNPIITLGAASIGIISGVISRYIIKKGVFFKVSVSVFVSHIIGSMIIKSIGLYVFFHYEIPILLWRIPLYIAISLCETGIIYAIVKNRRLTDMLAEKTSFSNRKGSKK